MNTLKYKKLSLLLLAATSFLTVDAKKAPVLSYRDDAAGVTAQLTGSISNSTSVNINNSLLNGAPKGARGDKVDAAYASKTGVDLTANVKHDTGIEAQASARAKMSWGSATNLSTSSSSIKYGEALIGSHSHTLEPRVLYVREAWVKCDLAKLLNGAVGNHDFTVGMFPFSVGRGIAFGDNFATNVESLGFFSNGSVDQYAPGMKWSGDFREKEFHYDLYWSVAKNSSAKLKETAEQIYDRYIVDGAYVPNTQFARGFGSVEMTTAGTVKWTPINNKFEHKKAQFEPYAVYTHSNEQKVDFVADAQSRLGTFGLAGEFEYGRLEFGFDTAVNCGSQDVFAWDRNSVTTKTDPATGALIQVYSHIYNEDTLTNKTIYAGDTNNYRPTVTLSEALNGEQIGVTGKYNANNRFRDAYKNKFKGWMFVVDGSVFVYKRDLKVSAAAGIASGDKNPNTEKTGAERDYKGFISQQESYSGKRVKSSFAMAGSLVRPRPLEFGDRFVPGIEGFTNIIFTGVGFTFEPKFWSKEFSINPNVLTFWQDEASKKYGSTEDASNRLGTELNVNSWLKLDEALKLKASGAVFLPGKHYTDIKGTAISKDVADMVKSAEGGVTEVLPTLSDSTAFAMSVGLEYSF